MIEIKVRCDRCNVLFIATPSLFNGEIKAATGSFASQMEFKKRVDSYIEIHTYDLCNPCRNNLDVMQRNLHDKYFEEMLTKPRRKG